MQKLSTLHLTRHFANAMLYAVLFCSMSCKYVGVAEGNLFFFGGGERREVKSSFAVFALGGPAPKYATYITHHKAKKTNTNIERK